MSKPKWLLLLLAVGLGLTARATGPEPVKVYDVLTVHFELPE
jgi:hypothetical protein